MALSVTGKLLQTTDQYVLQQGASDEQGFVEELLKHHRVQFSDYLFILSDQPCCSLSTDDS
jgi:hypothetical protein